MKRSLIVFGIVGAALLVIGCFPPSYNTHKLALYYAEQERKNKGDDYNPVCSVKPFKRDGTPQTIGIHFQYCNWRGEPIVPTRILGIELGIARFNLWWPPFYSISFGISGHKGFQHYLGMKWDGTEEDYLFSGAFRYHKIKRPTLRDMAGG